MLSHTQIEFSLQAAIREILPDADASIVLVRPCPDPKFGDYQSNALMSLAKSRKMNPRQLAENVLAKLDVSDVCEKVEIAGAGFLNFRLKNSTLAQTLKSAARGEHLFFEKAVACRKRLSLISVRRMSPSRCMSAISARRFLAIRWRARCGCSAIASLPTITSAIGERNLEFSLAGRVQLNPDASKRPSGRRWSGIYKINQAARMQVLKIRSANPSLKPTRHVTKSSNFKVATLKI